MDWDDRAQGPIAVCAVRGSARVGSPIVRKLAYSLGSHDVRACATVEVPDHLTIAPAEHRPALIVAAAPAAYPKRLVSERILIG